MNDEYLKKAGLDVAAAFAKFIEQEVLPGLPISPDDFWQGTAAILARFSPQNAALLQHRDHLQARIDAWHSGRAGQAIDYGEYQDSLREIGYLSPEPAPFEISPRNVDAEVGIAAPQLVVPITNARFLLNAANARWGSLYDALYGTDAIPGKPSGSGFDPARGKEVVTWSKDFLDQILPLKDLTWAQWTGGPLPLLDPACMVGMAGDDILLKHHGLHIELIIDRDHPIGRNDPAGIADIRLEAALTVIADLEDSVATVGTAEKVAGYRNWLGLMRGTLEASFDKGGHRHIRNLAPSRTYRTPGGEQISLSGRALMFVRNVGHHLMTSIIRLSDGNAVPEGVLDAIVTSLIGLHDIAGQSGGQNSRAGSIYIVKPKMRGPVECQFTNDLFNAVEEMLDLPPDTIKIGVMDEERQTSANLAACIAAVKSRIVFINTGFLDRTGDEINTSMYAGPMARKADMKQSRWMNAYEDRNVQIALACNFAGQAQIGKGMWAAPDQMADMLAQKIAHPQSGATTAWVPNPTAATLHATHYHLVDVNERQNSRRSETIQPIDDLLHIPLAQNIGWSEQERDEELSNNIQGIVGYVARWIDQGIGCSKIPDINGIGLMEDRATLRISSQHVANWLRHGIVTPEAVEEVLLRMARQVDGQNAADPDHRPLMQEPTLALDAARALILAQSEEAGGYTENVLNHFRALAQARDAQVPRAS